MPKKHTGVRIDEELIKRVEAYATRITKEQGIEVNRAMAIRMLIAKGLEAVEKPRGRRA